MIERVIIAGAGGQGIMLLGKILAEAAMREDRYVTWLPAYGAEVRGGTAHCMVVISDKEIGSPYIEKADTLIIMNQPSLRKFKERIKNKGVFIVNSSLAAVEKNEEIRALSEPFTELAIKLGNIKVANIIALGHYISHKKIIMAKTATRVIEKIAPADKRDLIEINKKALHIGMELK